MKTSLHNLRWGVFSLIDGDMISNFARTYGEWSECEVLYFCQILQPHDNVIEIGSNLGLHAVPIAKHIPYGRLFCFEPQRIIFQQLCCNLALNQITNAYTYHQGVSDVTTTIEIDSTDYTTPWNYGAFSLKDGFCSETQFTGKLHKETLVITTLDKHPDIQQLDAIKLLKIDVEGLEQQVLNGAKQTINKYRPIIFVETLASDNTDLLRMQLENFGYVCYWLNSHRYQPDNWMGANALDNSVDTNFVCYPKEQVAQNPDIIPSYLSVALPMSQYPSETIIDYHGNEGAVIYLPYLTKEMQSQL